MTKGFSIVVAMDKNRGIGKDGKLPWADSKGGSILKGDMKFFRELTTCPDREAVEARYRLLFSKSDETIYWETLREALKAAPMLPAPEEQKNAVIMGRKTWESLSASFRPLPDRTNRYLSRTGEGKIRDGGMVWPSLDHPMSELDDISIGEIFVIGGGQVFKTALSYPQCGHLYITEIDAEFECDTFFPETPGFAPVLSSPWIEENGIRYRFRRYDRIS